MSGKDHMTRPAAQGSTSALGMRQLGMEDRASGRPLERLKSEGVADTKRGADALATATKRNPNS